MPQKARELGISFRELPSDPQGEAEALMVLSSFTELHIIMSLKSTF